MEYGDIGKLMHIVEQYLTPRDAEDMFGEMLEIMKNNKPENDQSTEVFSLLYQEAVTTREEFEANGEK